MPTCSRPACVKARATGTIARSSRRYVAARPEMDARVEPAQDDGRDHEPRSSHTMSDGEVRYLRVGQIATVIFDRPAARNAMTWRMYEQLGEACARIRSEDGLRAAVFRGAGGKSFIAGTDIAQFETFRGGDD